MTSLTEKYRPLVGRRLAALAWRPITCDTPGLVLDIRKSIIEFSGTASLFFDEGREISLTWKNASDGDYYLGVAGLSDWDSFSLDLVHASHEDPWGQFIGARLNQASLYRESRPSGVIVALRHVFDSSAAGSDLWVGVGQNQIMQAGDDLVICVGPPANADELELVELVSAE